MEATKNAFRATANATTKLYDNTKAKITGQKYHDSLMGESLADVLRKATAKTLTAPDTECNQQVGILFDQLMKLICGGDLNV